MSDWLKTDQGDLVYGPEILSITRNGPVIRIEFFTDPSLDYTYDDVAAAITAFDAYVAALTPTVLLSNLIPVMTSDTTPSGTASASSVSGDLRASYAFDRNASTRWVAGGAAPQWVSYQFDSIAQTALECYVVVHTGTASWTLEGSNDGAAWTVLDTQVAQSEVVATIASPAAYLYYRLNISASSATPQIRTFEIRG